MRRLLHSREVPRKAEVELMGNGSIQYFQMRDFEKSMSHAMQAGGPGKKAAVKVKAVLGSLESSDPFSQIVTTTNHGESRIPHCIKYDLGSGWRLITTQHAQTCGFLLMAKHDDADRWLENNRGQRFAVENGRATVAPGVGAAMSYGRPSLSGHQDRKLVDRIEPDLADYLLDGVSRRVARGLEALDGLATWPDLAKATEVMAGHDKRGLVEAVLNQVMAGNIEGAETRIRLEMGAIPALDELDEDALLEVGDGQDVRRLRIGSDEYQDWLESFEKRTKWYEWFLFMHPEQERVVTEDYPGSSQLSGVSGSGKTCVAVRRALRLAAAPEARVLLVTLNRSLAGLLDQLVEAACTDPELRKRIKVTSFFELAQELLLQFEPENARSYRDVTWKLDEHVDEIFREYYRQWLNSRKANVMLPLHVSLNARGVDGETYIRDEFDWIRSAVATDDREAYLDISRRGRRFPILSDRRQEILDGLRGWEAKMRDIGVVDYLGLTSALSHHLDSIEPEFTNVIIDEAQDFGTTELRIIRQLVPPGENDLFLCGDVAQTILPKHRSLTEAGVPTVTRRRIVRNYRNTREILLAAYELLRNNLHEDMLDSEDLEILDPEFASSSGPVPIALAADNLEEEIAFARAFAESRLKTGAKTVCIAFAGFSTRDVRRFAGECGVMALDGAYDPSNDKLVFCDLEQTKGYEFDTMIILQCTDRVLPPRGGPAEEAHRFACKLYVAMTRARRELILSFHGSVSPWIAAVSDSIATDLWADVEELDSDLLSGVPDRLPEIHPDNELREASLLTGLQFVYTPYAMNLSIAAQQKLIDLVDGRGQVQGGTGKRLKWPNVRSLLRDIHANRSYDRFVGASVVEELRALPN